MSDRMILGVGVSGVGGNDVADPAERAAASDPEPRGHDQPEDAAPEVAVVELPDARDDQAEHRRRARVLWHRGEVFHDQAYARNRPQVSCASLVVEFCFPAVSISARRVRQLNEPR